MKKFMILVLAIISTAAQADNAVKKYVLFETTDVPSKELKGKKDTYDVEIDFIYPSGYLYTRKKRPNLTIKLKGADQSGKLTRFVSVELNKGFLHKYKKGEGYIRGIKVEGQAIDPITIATLNSAIEQYQVDLETGKPATGKPMLTFIIREIGGKYTISAHMGNPTARGEQEYIETTPAEELEIGEFQEIN